MFEFLPQEASSGKVRLNQLSSRVPMAKWSDQIDVQLAQAELAAEELPLVSKN